ncbi:hypothetical protein [Noviherbaspirillum galbum]|uniref:Uncharacterized protein n=1 Tax=Noviherbaspirillum galbum TaxID=2709383 RepID=A0A6B3SH12_9BURK|nr:hypothetical protein [Noviherbaspirillum galbum]NEX60141.1 hypothetical protein [Noviherbaspirillum galbum]
MKVNSTSLLLAAMLATLSASCFAQVPKTNDVLGVHTGDTEDKVMAALKGSGYALAGTMKYAASPGLAASTAELVFHNSATGSTLKTKFTPVTGKVMFIDREDRPAEKPSVKAVVDAMIAKYGTPSSAFDSNTRLEWRMSATGTPETGQNCKFLVNISRYEAQRCGISVFATVFNTVNPQIANAFTTKIWDYRVTLEDFKKQDELMQSLQNKEIDKARSVSAPKL